MDIVAICSTWQPAIHEDTVHLDPRCRWTPPTEHEGLYSFANPFRCPFAKCDATCQGADECAQHINNMKHPKRSPKDSPQWVCVGR